MKILAALDRSDDSKLAVAEIARRPWPEGSELKLVHVEAFPFIVTDVMGVGGAAARTSLANEVSRDTEILDQYANTIRAGSSAGALSITTEVITASPTQSTAEVIVDEAKSFGADLIVVGSRGHSTWRQLLLGSVSNAVVHHAPCSVEIVRAKLTK
ncbi:MAG: universal stress protein [Pyrinomonadaceae bacterium]